MKTNKCLLGSNLVTKAALNTVENKIPDVTNLVKKIDYTTKVTEIENKLNNHNHNKYIDTSEFNKLAVDVFNARLTPANFKLTQASIKLLWYQNKSKIYWKLFKTIKNFIYSWKSTKYLH